MVSASTLRRQLDQIRKLLAVREDDFPHLPPLPPMTDEEVARGVCQIWRCIAHRYPGPDLDDGIALVEWYEGIASPTPSETRRFRRLIHDSWNAMAPGRVAPVYPYPPDLEGGE
jgi:hypothetical protein